MTAPDTTDKRGHYHVTAIVVTETDLAEWAERTAATWEHWDCTFDIVEPGSTGALGLTEACQALVDSGAPDVPPKQLFAALLAVIRRLAEGLTKSQRKCLHVVVRGDMEPLSNAVHRLEALGLAMAVGDWGGNSVYGPTPRGRAVLRYLESQR
jgi:hypothetical protein